MMFFILFFYLIQGSFAKVDPKICVQKPDPGNCKALIVRYFYNFNTQACEEFSYGGCGGNDNNFDSIEDCSESCKANQINFDYVTNYKCFQAKKRGICEKEIKRYYFNSTSMTCQTFIYSGCGQNENNFETEQQCEQTCSQVIKKQRSMADKICTLPRDSGRCKASFERFYFNSISKKCESFDYGGCEGNLNNFMSLQECQQICE